MFRPRSLLVALSFAVVFWSSTSRASAQFMQRASVGDAGKGGPFELGCDVSSDGRFVVFNSISNLTESDTNDTEDVYVKDMESGAVEVASVASDGSLANGRSYMGRVSDDGNVVVFSSEATNLVEGDTNGVLDVFVRDRAAGTTTRVSLREDGGQANGDCRLPDVSGDGSLVAFETQAALVAGDTDNGEFDVYAVDRVTGALQRVSVATDGGNGGRAHNASIDASGVHVGFDSTASNLVEGDTNDASDVFVRDLSLALTVRVSITSAGHQVFDHSHDPSLSADGSVVAFQSYSANLVPDDLNDEGDVFVHDSGNGLTQRISVATDGTEADNDSFEPSISGDGKLVAFSTQADNLLTLPQTSLQQVLLRRRGAKTTTLVSETALGRSGQPESRTPALSSDGNFVAFYSNADDLIPRDPGDGIYRRDLNAPPDWGFAASYGDGFPGTLGIPELSAPNPPSLGTTFELDATNSFGAWTLGLLVTGFTQTSIELRGGGTLLASPDLLLVVPIPPWGYAATSDLPFDEDWSGLDAYAQMLELDDGAIGGLSFTAGLQLHFGR